MTEEQTCQACGHDWVDHYSGDGCYGGWQYDSEGVAVNEGCLCLLAHSRYSRPSHRERPKKSEAT